MKKFYLSIIVLIMTTGCNKVNNASSSGIEKVDAGETEMLVDSLLYFRHNFKKTDILSRHLPDITREQGIELQLAMLQKELASGSQLVGWKMARTVNADSASYDPLFGYILSEHLISADSIVSAKNFPGEQALVEGEVGFIMKKDFKHGASSMDELKEGIDYVVNAVEFAQSIAIPANGNPQTRHIDHIMASGMGQAGVMIGSGRVTIDDFDLQNETVKCFINDKLVAEGISSNIYGSPLNALNALANLLPKYGAYLKKGDVVVTGSVYNNPTINSECNVRLEFNSLGTINFSME